MNFKSLAALTLATSAVPFAAAGPLAYALCQTGCNGLAVMCYTAAGFIFGTVAAPAAPAVILGCNAALGTCMVACAATALIAPIP